MHEWCPPNLSSAFFAGRDKESNCLFECIWKRQSSSRRRVVLRVRRCKNCGQQERLLQVSVDFRCTDVSTTIDSSLTMVMGDDMVKVVAWYDNEWGYR